MCMYLSELNAKEQKHLKKKFVRCMVHVVNWSSSLPRNRGFESPQAYVPMYKGLHR
jgi:hypothetical protein